MTYDIFESAVEYRESYDLKNQRYFKEYKHNEPTDIASKKIEAKLKEINPKSIVVRHDETSFTIVHPGGHLITNVETVKGRHYLSTNYMSPLPKDYGLENGDVIKNGNTLYESIDMEYVVHDENGHVYIRHKNLYRLRQSLAKLQHDYFKVHHRRRNIRHRFFISSRHAYMNRFGRHRLYEDLDVLCYENLNSISESPIDATQIVFEDFSEANEVMRELSEAYKDTYVVHYAHTIKKTGERSTKKMRINFAFDETHAKKIASNVAKQRSLKGFSIKKVEV